MSHLRLNSAPVSSLCDAVPVVCWGGAFVFSPGALVKFSISSRQ